MKLLLAGAMLCAITIPAFAHDAIAPYSNATKCVPYADAMKQISGAGGHVLAEYDAPFVRNAKVLYYEYEGVVVVTGTAKNDTCVYMAPAILGRLAFDPRDL
jgi:hypothetical protein